MNTGYKKIKKQISYSAIYKIVTLILNYILIALLIKYLGQEKFGIYVALTSLFSWMFMFDLGMAKGMRNFVTIALSENKINKAKEYISTAYIAIFGVAIISCLFIILLLYLIDIQNFFQIDIDNIHLRQLFLILITSFFIKFYFSTVDQLNFAIHQSQKVVFNKLLVALFNFFSIYILWLLDYQSSIMYAISAFSISLVLPYLYSTIEFFMMNKMLKPSISKYSNKVLKKIFNSGSKILFIQIGFLLIIGVDRLILLKYGSAIEVSKYEIIYKVMSVVIFPVSIIITPLWSSFTDAYTKNDINWIKKIFKLFYFSMILLFVILVLLSYFFNDITLLWLNDFPPISFFTAFIMGILILEMLWSSIHTDFLLGNQYFSFITKLISIGLILKFLFLYYIISIGKLNVIFMVTSSIIAYGLYNIIVPFYIKKLLKKKYNNYSSIKEKNYSMINY